MRIHHLDCGPARPLGGALMDGVSPGAIGRLTCHCLAVETPRHGVVLVDTGLGMRDMLRPSGRLPSVNSALLRFRYDPNRTMLRHMKRLGLHPSDVRHIIMTHLDFDHAGGLVDFPQATVHLTEAEAEAEAGAAHARQGVLGHTRYRPMQWGDTRRWRTYPDRPGGDWYGFDAVLKLDGLPQEFALVPLPGHSAGHAGVAIETPRGWVLHAGDAYFNRAEIFAEPPHCPPGSAAYEAAMAWSGPLVRAQQRRVRALAQASDSQVLVFCTHETVEYVAFSAWSERQRAPANENAAAA